MFPPEQLLPQPQSREEALELLRQNEQQRRDETEARLQWDYSPEELAQFDALDYRPGRRLIGPLLILLAGLAVAVGLVVTRWLPRWLLPSRW